MKKIIIFSVFSILLFSLPILFKIYYYSDVRLSLDDIINHQNTIKEIKEISTATDKIYKTNFSNGLNITYVKRTFNNGDFFYYFTIKNNFGTNKNIKLDLSKIIDNSVIEYKFDFKPYNIKKEYSTLVGYDKLKLPDLYLETNTKSFIISQNFYYDELIKEYENHETSVLRRLYKQEYTIDNKFNNTIKIKQNQNVDFYILSSNEKMFNKNNEEIYNFIELINNRDISSWLSYNGNYYKLPYSIEPYTKEGYGINLNNNSEKNILKKYIDTNKKIYYNLVCNSIMNFLNYFPRNEHGIWYTSYTSTWLKKDYDIRAPYIDTRHNENIGYYLNDVYKILNINELENIDRLYADYLIYEYNQENTINFKDYQIFPDYFSTNEHKITHSSLNHQLAIINYLLKSYIKYKNEDYKKIAIKILSTINYIGDDWIRDNNDLWYRINEKYEFKGTDYKVLTLSDLLLTKKLLLSINKDYYNNNNLDKLIDSKIRYLQSINYEIPKYIQNLMEEVLVY